MTVEPTTACEVRLFRENGRLIREHSISPKISKGILVDPGRNEYYVEISCNGHPGEYRSNTLVMDDGRKTFDLGPITLTSK